MSAKRYSRRYWFVDPRLQGALIRRLVLYWAACLAATGLMLWCSLAGTRPEALSHGQLGQVWVHFGPVVIVSLFLLPVMIVDVIRFSNRFVGPLLRLRRSMRQLARGEHVEPIEFRQGDYWLDLAEEFNAVVARTQGPPNVACSTDWDPGWNEDQQTVAIA
jgi:hypothetical protein